MTRQGLRHGLLFTMLGVIAILLGIAIWSAIFSVLWIWMGASFGVVGVAYLRTEPRFLGKRVDGSIPLSRGVALFPFFGLTYAAWQLQRCFSREAPCHEVAPGIWVARRPVGRELPSVQMAAVVDMTAELPRARCFDGRASYLCLPTLDGIAPAEAALRDVLMRLAAIDGPVYIHCASGHGRSAMVAAALLVVRGQAGDGVSAEISIRSVRHGVRLSRAQRDSLDRLQETLRHRLG